MKFKKEVYGRREARRQTQGGDTGRRRADDEAANAEVTREPRPTGRSLSKFDKEPAKRSALYRRSLAWERHSEKKKFLWRAPLRPWVRSRRKGRVSMPQSVAQVAGSRGFGRPIAIPRWPRHGSAR